MKIPMVEGEAIPEGEYVGRFLGVVEQDEQKWKEAGYKHADGTLAPRGIVWQWEVVGGAHDGRVADRLTPAAATKGNNTTIFAEIMTGKRFVVGGEFDPDALIGTLWRFRVDRKDTGKGTYVSFKGLSRAHDLERAPDVKAAVNAPPADGPTGEVWVFMNGMKTPTSLTLAALRVAVKNRVSNASDRAGVSGDKEWGTVRGVCQRVFPEEVYSELYPPK